LMEASIKMLSFSLDPEFIHVEELP
jgi:hypothetical protein